VTSLSKLSLTKAFDNKTTVLHFLVKQVRRAKQKELLKLSKDFSISEPASRLTVPALLQELNELSTELSQIARLVDEQERAEGGFSSRGELKVSTLRKAWEAANPKLEHEAAASEASAPWDDPISDAINSPWISDRAIADAPLPLQDFRWKAEKIISVFTLVLEQETAFYRDTLKFLGQDSQLEVATLFGELHKFCGSLDRTKFEVDEQERRESLASMKRGRGASTPMVRRATMSQLRPGSVAASRKAVLSSSDDGHPLEALAGGIVPPPPPRSSSKPRPPTSPSEH